MKIAIQALRENPRSAERVLKRERPGLLIVLSADHYLRRVAREAGYKESSSAVLKRVAKRTRSKLLFLRCNLASPESVARALGQALKKISPRDTLVINYSGGTAVTSLILGAAGAILADAMRVKVVYSGEPGQATRMVNHARVLKEMFWRILPPLRYSKEILKARSR